MPWTTGTSSNRLSVQYGIRYDALPHAWERNNHLASFDPRQYQTALAPSVDPNTGAFCTATTETGCPIVSAGLQTYKGAQFYLNGVTIAGQNGTPRGMTENYYKTYMPRVGFSYDLTGTARPFFAAALAPSSSACRATMCTTLRRRLRSRTRQA